MKKAKNVNRFIGMLTIIFVALFIMNFIYGQLGINGFTKVVSAKEISDFSRDLFSENSYKINNVNYNNAALEKCISVRKNTLYELSCCIKTSNVEILNSSIKNSGAKICIDDMNIESNALTGSNDWTKIKITFYSGNRTSVNLRLLLAGSSEDGNVKGTAWFSDIDLVELSFDSSTTWNFAFFIFKNTNVQINESFDINTNMNGDAITDKNIDEKSDTNSSINESSNTNIYIYEKSDTSEIDVEKSNSYNRNNSYEYSMNSGNISQLEDCIYRFKNTIEEMSSHKINANVDIIYIDADITKLSYDEENGYYMAPSDAEEYISEYIKNNSYNHIFTCMKLCDESSSIPLNNNWLGLGNMKYEGIGFSNIRVPKYSDSDLMKYSEKNTFPEEVFVHEFLHTLEHNALEVGMDVPRLHNYQQYGYLKDENNGLYEWYKDYLNKAIISDNLNIGLDEIILKNNHKLTNYVN